MNIKSNKDFKNFFSKNKPCIFGAGANPAYKLGLEEVYDEYAILNYQHTYDSPYIARETFMLTLEDYVNFQEEIPMNNATGILSHKDIQKYLDSDPRKKYILSYKGRPKLEALCEQKGWISAVGSVRFGKDFLEDKIQFRSLLEKLQLPYIFYETINLHVAKEDFQRLQQKFSLPFVIQYPYSGGGTGTFFIYNQEDFNTIIATCLDRINSNIHYSSASTIIVSKFITGPSLSISGVATRWGTFTSRLQVQISDEPSIIDTSRGSGLFCGHDWSKANELSEQIHQQAIEYTKKFGEHIYSLGYKGFFGLDLMLDIESQTLYILECNPRFTGVMPVLDMIQMKNEYVPFNAVHMAEYLADDFQIELDYESIQSQTSAPKEGSHYYVTSVESTPTKATTDLLPGRFIFDGRLERKGDGIKMKHIQSLHEFIISEVVTPKTYIGVGFRIAHILHPSSILDHNYRLHKEIEAINRAFYNSFQFVEAPARDSGKVIM